jgi:helix-turn-helix protein/uncharacterized protein DUF4115
MFEIGNSLREARLRQKLDFPELEQAVKVRAKYLRALEEEEFDILPASTYVKGFLRAYADYLGLDGQLYVDEYNSRFVADDEHHSRQIRTRRSSVQPRRHRRLEGRILAFVLTGIAAAAALVFVAFRFGGTSPDPTQVANVGGGQRAVSTPLPRVPVVRRQAGGAAGKPAARLARVVATALHGNTWLEVHAESATGRLLFQGTLERGKSVPLAAKRIWINVAVPENLRLRLNGRLVPIAQTASPQVLVVSPRGVARA